MQSGRVRFCMTAQERNTKHQTERHSIPICQKHALAVGLFDQGLFAFRNICGPSPLILFASAFGHLRRGATLQLVGEKNNTRRFHRKAEK